MKRKNKKSLESTNNSLYFLKNFLLFFPFLWLGKALFLIFSSASFVDEITLKIARLMNFVLCLRSSLPDTPNNFVMPYLSLHVIQFMFLNILLLLLSVANQNN